MVKVVSWNIGKREKPWRELAQMASEGDADLALLQEAGSPPGDLVDRIEYVDGVFWNRHLYDRWPLVVKLSDRITVEPYRQVPPISDLGEDAIGVSGIGTIAAGRVIPRDNEEEAFVESRCTHAGCVLIRLRRAGGVSGTRMPPHIGSFRTCPRSSVIPTLRRIGSWLRVI